jgi:cobalt-zinc-cadmium efflux system outer membrane protein
MVTSQGCAPRSSHDRDYVSRKIEERTGRSLSAEGKPGEFRIPPGVDLNRLSEDDAVAVALWDNAALQRDLADLGFSRADLLESGLLKNPVFSIFFPLGPKQMEFTLTAPFEALWQRPRRMSIAKLSAEATAERLVQNGLGLAGQVRVAFAELWLAEEKAKLAAEALQVHSQIEEIADARLRAGDISEAEAVAIRSRTAMARDEARSSKIEIAIAKERLRALMGVGLTDAPVQIAASPLPAAQVPEPAPLMKMALASRPDLRAAELQLEAAGKRLGLEQSKIIAIAGMLDANAEGREGFEAGPGILATLPFFDANQGGTARARAEMQRAAHHYVEIQRQIALEVFGARNRLLQARESLETWRTTILPSLEQAQKAAQQAYAVGEASYLEVLEATRELLLGRVRACTLEADLRREWARLEQAVGRKL